MPQSARRKTNKNKSRKKKQEKRIEALLKFDRDIIFGAAGGQLELFKRQPRAVIGVDEVGRGCLAGPVVASAVMLKELSCDTLFNMELADLDDSKKLPHEIREKLSVHIRSGDGAEYAIAECSAKEIDRINILKASLLAMKKAVTDLLSRLPYELEEVVLLVDGNKRIDFKDIKQITVIKGDSHSASIAAASVVAKVYRDGLMKELAEKYPQYLWHSNKGYPSKAHKEAIQIHGLTKWHRKTFRWQINEEENI